MSTGTRVIRGNRLFPKPGEFAGDRATLIVNWPKALRFIARQLVQQGHWLSFPIEMVARDWDSDPAVNLARLNDIMAHADLLTDAQISYLNAAITKLQERSQ